MRAWLESPVREAAQVFVNGTAGGRGLESAVSNSTSPGLMQAGQNTIRVVVANLALNVLAKSPLPDYKELNAKYGEKFQAQDMQSVRPLPGGMLRPGETGLPSEPVPRSLRIGLLLAAAMSVTNVMTDVWRKRALEKRELFPVDLLDARRRDRGLRRRAAGADCCAACRSPSAMAGCCSALVQLAPVPTFLIYLLLDVSLITIVMWLYFRALQISPLSMCIPFLAFTPVFLIPSTYIILGQKPQPHQAARCGADRGGIAGHAPDAVRGGLAGAGESGDRVQGQPLHADCGVDLFAYQSAGRQAGGDERCLHRGLRLRDRPLHFVLSAHANAARQFRGGIAGEREIHCARRAVRRGVAAVSTGELRVHSGGDHGEHQARGHRAGGVRGWLFFRERGITDKVIAATVMFCGVLILYLPVTPVGGAGDCGGDPGRDDDRALRDAGARPHDPACHLWVAAAWRRTTWAVYRDLDWVRVVNCIDAVPEAARKAAEFDSGRVATPTTRRRLTDESRCRDHQLAQSPAPRAGGGGDRGGQARSAAEAGRAEPAGRRSHRGGRREIRRERSGLYMSYFDQPLIHDLRDMVRRGLAGRHRPRLRAADAPGRHDVVAGSARRASRNWRGSVAQTGGGCFIQLAVHYLHIFEWATGARVVRASGFTRNLHCPGLEGEDIAVGIFELDTGAMVTIDTAWCTNGEELSIHGTQGRFTYRDNKLALCSTGGRVPRTRGALHGRAGGAVRRRLGRRTADGNPAAGLRRRYAIR